MCVCRTRGVVFHRPLWCPDIIRGSGSIDRHRKGQMSSPSTWAIGVLLCLVEPSDRVKSPSRLASGPDYLTKGRIMMFFMCGHVQRAVNPSWVSAGYFHHHHHHLMPYSYTPHAGIFCFVVIINSETCGIVLETKGRFFIFRNAESLVTLQIFLVCVSSSPFKRTFLFFPSKNRLNWTIPNEWVHATH